MGYYIEVPQPRGKAQQLADLHGATLTTCPATFEEVPEGQALLCIVDNGPFEAVALCYDVDEFNVFNDPEDPRPRQWMLMEQTKAHELAGYTGREGGQ